MKNKNVMHRTTTTVTRGDTLFIFNADDLYNKIRAFYFRAEIKSDEELLIVALALAYRHKDGPLGRAIKNRISIFKSTKVIYKSIVTKRSNDFEVAQSGTFDFSVHSR